MLSGGIQWGVNICCVGMLWSSTKLIGGRNLKRALGKEREKRDIVDCRLLI